jgi:hypothetical protein
VQGDKLVMAPNAQVERKTMAAGSKDLIFKQIA